MPELPEVETVARQLDNVLRNKKIIKIKVLREVSFKGEKKSLLGRVVRSVSRVAKMLVISFTRGDEVLVVHLKMTGQLVWRADDWNQEKMKQEVVGGHPTVDWMGDLPSKHTRVIISFRDGSRLFFNDLRVFGWMRVMKKLEWQKINAGLPLDVIDREFSLVYFENVLKRSKRAIKLVLMDQQKIGGLGNIYVNDALFKAGVDPRRPSNDLRKNEIKKLYKAIRDVITLGIKYGGATYSNFVAASGLGGLYQEHFLVYGKEGEKCKRCGNKIKKIMIGGRGSYYCKKCQS